ncbi:MAG: hypothetical protein GC190_13635 [Alphaproteobacteria bacterium]|nr:hypothetical protein [Alphaproteobacteria bacterium]
MGGSQRTSSWFDLIAPLNYFVGTAMALVAAYLMRPSLVDLGFYVEGRRYELVALFLIYAAFVLVAATLWRDNTRTTLVGQLASQILYGPGPLLGTAIIEAVLAGKALLADPLKLWVAAFAVPAILAITTMIDSDVRSTKRRHGGGEKHIDGETDSDTGKTAARNIVTGFLIAGVSTAAAMVPFFLMLALGFALFYSLDAVIFAGEDRSLTWFIGVVPRVFQDALPRILPAVVAIGVVLPLLGVVFAVTNWLTKIGRKNVDRDLSHAEIDFVERALAALQHYIAGQGRRRGRAALIGFVLLLVMIIAPTVVLLIWHDWIVATLYEPARVRGLGWYIYVDDVGPGSVAVLFASIFVFWSLTYVVYRIWPGLAERLAATTSEASLLQRLVSAVRRGELKIGQDFDPGKFLRDSSLMHESLVHIATAVVVFLTVVLWYRDRADYDLITDNSIVAGDYWTLKPIQFSYADVRGVEIECWINDKGNLDIGYDIRLPSQRYVPMVQSKHISTDLDKYAVVDEKLRALGKPFGFAVRRPLARAAFVAFDPDCVRRISEDRGLARDRVERIFHLDDWYQQLWKKRTKP